MRRLSVAGYLFAFGLLLSAFPAGDLRAQAPGAPSAGGGFSLNPPRPEITGRPRVYFDCQGPQCDQTYYRTEINWVDWVRQPQDAHVHIIMTSQTTGGGGREYILDYIGRDVAEGYEITDRFRSGNTDTQREQLDGVAYTLALGLARFADAVGFRNLYRVVPYEGDVGARAIVPVDRIVSPDEVEDPWNLWTFRVNGNGNFSGEETSKTLMVSGGFNASRTTPTWKTSTGASWNYRVQENELRSGLRVDKRTNWSLNTTIVYSIAEHWSVGIRGGPARQEQQNQRFRIQANPAVEFSFFPYEEATRRSLTAFYELGPVYRDYIDTTLYDKDSEVLMEQALTIDYSARQPWGNASVTLNASSYLHDLGLHNLGLNGNVSYRITRGINLNLSGSVRRIQDQIYLPRGELSDEELLLRIRSAATDWSANASMGLSWQFGSILNNVVNNRFPGGGGGGGGGPGGF